MEKIYKSILLLSVAFIFIACGRKGDPLPPISKKPLYVNSLKLRQQGNNIVVLWNYIPRYDDNRVLKEFFFKIYLNGENINPKIYSKGNLYWFSFKIPNFKKEYCFNMYVVSKNEESDNSPIECIIPSKDYPDKPKILDIELKEDGLLIKWNGEGDFINIYRSNDELIPPLPLKRIKNLYSYLDKDLVFNKRYCYYITTENKEAESEKSNTVCKDFIDIFSPKPPSDFKLLKKNNDYYLIWEESPSKDVIGYIIYKNGKPLFNIPIKTYFFIDKNYKTGDKYFIVAVDRAGNRSEKVYLEKVIE